MSELAQAVFTHAAEGILVLDRQRRIRAANPAAERLLGRSAADMAGTLYCYQQLQCRDAAGEALTACRCLQVTPEAPAPGVDLVMHSAEGRDVPVTISAAAMALDGEELVVVVIRDMSHQRLLYNLARDLAAVADFDASVRRALDRIRLALALDVAGLLELDDSGEYLYYRALSGTRIDFSHARVPVAESLHGAVITAGVRQVIPSLPEEVSGWHGRGPLLAAEGVESAVFLPLKSRGRILGSLVLGSRQRREFTAAELELLDAAAAQLAVAFDNYRLYARLRDEAVAEERQRLAAEIHDSLAQTIAIIGQRVKQLPKVLAGDRQEAAQFIENLERVVNQGHREVRQAIFDLKSPVGLGSSFIDSLREYLEEFAMIHRIPVELVHPPGIEFVVPLQVEVQLSRIIQEALNNVRRHSGASRAWVKFDRRGTGFMAITIQDDGTGFDPSARRAKGHYGLQIMQERAKAIGGILTVRSRPGGGTAVELEIPLMKE